MTLRPPDDLTAKQNSVEERTGKVHAARKEIVARGVELARALRSRRVDAPDFNPVIDGLASARRALESEADRLEKKIRPESFFRTIGRFFGWK